MPMPIFSLNELKKNSEELGHRWHASLNYLIWCCDCDAEYGDEHTVRWQMECKEYGDKAMARKNGKKK